MAEDIHHLAFEVVLIQPNACLQGRTLGGQSSLLANYNGLNSLYGAKPGLNNVTTTPGILGATASMKNNANRFHPGLPTKPLPPDLHRSMMAQVYQQKLNHHACNPQGELLGIFHGEKAFSQFNLASRAANLVESHLLHQRPVDIAVHIHILHSVYQH